MTVFVDTSTLLAASWSAKGLSRLLIEHAEAAKWGLVTADYCISEVEKTCGNISRVGQIGNALFVRA